MPIILWPWEGIDTTTEVEAWTSPSVHHVDVSTSSFWFSGTTPVDPERSTEASEQVADLDFDSLRELAGRRPLELARLIQRAELTPPVLTFAAEAAGHIVDAEIAVPPLLALLAHESPLVREGAIYGLGKHLSRPDVVERLRLVADQDQSPGVKLAAKEALDD